jgi:Fe-S-cluster containining protein
LENREGVISVPELALKIKGCSSIAEINAVTRQVFGFMEKTLANYADVLGCEKGCHYCCHYRVLLRPFEVFAIKEFLQTADPRFVQAAMTVARKNLERIGKMTSSEHMLTNIPCPFLTGGECGIYPVRPAKCRDHHSLTPEICKIEHENPANEHNILQSSELMTDLQSMYQGISMAFQMVNMDVSAYELNGAMVEVFRDAGAGKKWMGKKRVFPSKHLDPGFIG